MDSEEERPSDTSDCGNPSDSNHRPCPPGTPDYSYFFKDYNYQSDPMFYNVIDDDWFKGKVFDSNGFTGNGLSCQDIDNVKVVITVSRLQPVETFVDLVVNVLMVLLDRVKYVWTLMNVQTDHTHVMKVLLFKYTRWFQLRL